MGRAIGSTGQMEIIDRKTNTCRSKGQENSSEVVGWGRGGWRGGWVRGCGSLAELAVQLGSRQDSVQAGRNQIL